MKNNYTLLGLMLLGTGIQTEVSAQFKATFDSLFTSVGQYKEGTGAAVNGFNQSGNVSFPNSYQTQYGGFWSDGWSISNMQNDTTAGYTNMYSAYAGAAQSGNNYMVGQGGSMLIPTGADAGKTIKGLYVTNGTYPALSMRDGDMFAKKFGGVSGNDADYFALSVFAYHNGVKSTDSVAFYLADYRDANNSLDYIVKQWTYVDLTSLGSVDSLVFQLNSSDEGQFGMNTPGFFCIDDVVTDSDTSDIEEWVLMPNAFYNRTDGVLNSSYVVGPMVFSTEYTVTQQWGNFWSGGFAPSTMTDTTTAGFGNLFSAYAGSGAEGTWGYAIAQNHSVVTLGSTGARLDGVYITNGTYAALSMRDGDAFAKKFGGLSGNDSDWFKVTFVGFNGSNTDTVEAYLADYRSADNSQDYIIKDWKWVNLSKLGVCDSMMILLSSSDNGQFGMNTPGFLAIDGLSVSPSTGLKSTKYSDIGLSMYPNPASDVLTVESALAVTSLEVIDLAGKVVISTNEAFTHKLDVSALPAGMYLVRASSALGANSYKLIKH